MANSKIKMLNKKASDPKNRPDEIIEAIKLKPGQSIADIGAGGGYFSIRFAEIVKDKGKVYAIDIKQEFLEYIKNAAKEKGLNNIVPILVKEKSTLNLPEESLDLIFMRNVSHHISNRVKYFRDLKNFLKSDGRIVIIEYKKGNLFSFHRLFGHYIPKEIIKREMKEAGYLLEKEFDILPEQSFLIYLKQ